MPLVLLAKHLTDKERKVGGISEVAQADHIHRQVVVRSLQKVHLVEAMGGVR